MSSLSRKAKIWLSGTSVVVLAGMVVAGYAFFRLHGRNRTLSVTGAIVQQNEDTKKQSPIGDVVVSVANDLAAGPTKSNTSGYFRLDLKPTVKRSQPITLQFRQPKYQPLDLKTTTGDMLYVVQMVPLVTDDGDKPGNKPPVVVANVVIRYSTETNSEMNVGTGVTTFQVPNTGGVPCDPRGPCSPDGRWKASIGGASLDAGEGNVFRNARVFCIAGPCPFTKIESDDFSRGGRHISASVRNWSDTTTFLFQAEVFRQQVSDIVRESYPVIYGRTFNFSLPSSAEGPSLEAELDKMPITFPLGPDPKLSWASCSVIFGSRLSKSYRCELKQGYKFP
jgi:hypothetical protein